MAQGVQQPWQGADDYDHAVEAAGVAELPDEFVGGEGEDREPWVVSR